MSAHQRNRRAHAPTEPEKKGNKSYHGKKRKARKPFASPHRQRKKQRLRPPSPVSRHRPPLPSARTHPPTLIPRTLTFLSSKNNKPASSALDGRDAGLPRTKGKPYRRVCERINGCIREYVPRCRGFVLVTPPLPSPKSSSDSHRLHHPSFQSFSLHLVAIARSTKKRGSHIDTL